MTDPEDDLFSPTVAPKPPAARLRPPRFAGRFYPDDPAEMRREAQALVGRPATGLRAVGLVLPHGPWAQTGALAGKALAHAQLEETVVVLGPNHAGRGARAAIVCDGAYALPGGTNIPIESSLAESIRALAGLTESAEAFAEDHAIEAILPLLHAAQPRLAIVPVALHDVGLPTAIRIGAAIADAIVGRGHGVTLIATTDLAHYVPRASLAAATDGVLTHTAALDEAALVESVRARASLPGPVIETCGLGALFSFVTAMHALDAPAGQVIGRFASSETGPVVGWAAISYAR
ncbi:MAG: AmmeMemoRadiSam system protein B [Polyangiales bacterium]